MERVLVVDDDLRLAELVATTIARDGYVTEIAGSGGEALAKVARTPPDVMLLDFEMPEQDGLAVIEALRQPDGTTPFPVVIFTGGRMTEHDEVMALQWGATDYIRKGADSAVVRARIDSALRPARLLRARCQRLDLGRLVVDMSAAQVILDGVELQIENRVYGLLCYLAQRAGQMVSRDELLENVWGTTYVGFHHSVDQAVYQLRKSLGDARWVKTIQRKGYRFVVL